MQRFFDEHGNEVRLTDERLRHILRRHPEMAFQMHRLYPDLRGRNRYICLVVKRGADYSFILIGYLGRSIKGD